MRSFARSTAALLLGAALPLAAAAAQGTTAGTSSGAGASGTPANPVPAGSSQQMPRTVAGQNRELDQIGNKLLKETPRNTPNSSATTGGSLEPPH